MPRIAPIDYSDASPAIRAAHDDHVRQHARITNMKRTLLNSPARVPGADGVVPAA